MARRASLFLAHTDLKPYESPEDRARALYRIPTATAQARLLELYCERAPLFEHAPWYGASKTCRAVRAGATLDFAPGAFDLIVLHRTLDDLTRTARAAFDARAFMRELAALIAPGGLVAGCIDNRFSPKLALRGRIPRYSARACAELLRASGFIETSVCALGPHCDAPQKILDLEAHGPKFVLRNDLQSLRAHLSWPGYLARRALIETGWYARLEQSLFFWGYKPC